LLGYNILRLLNLADTSESVDAATLTNGLSGNCTLESLNLDPAFQGDDDISRSEAFRALCEGLCGNTTLRYLNVNDNDVSLETLHLDENTFTSCGIIDLSRKQKTENRKQKIENRKEILMFASHIQSYRYAIIDKLCERTKCS
jgi:hypothetical protein